MNSTIDFISSLYDKDKTTNSGSGSKFNQKYYNSISLTEKIPHTKHIMQKID